MDDYEVLDTFTGFSIDPGDLIRVRDRIIVVESVESVDGGYNVEYFDELTDEADTLFLEEDEYVELLG